METPSIGSLNEHGIALANAREKAARALRKWLHSEALEDRLQYWEAFTEQETFAEEHKLLMLYKTAGLIRSVEQQIH